MIGNHTPFINIPTTTTDIVTKSSNLTMYIYMHNSPQSRKACRQHPVAERIISDVDLFTKIVVQTELDQVLCEKLPRLDDSLFGQLCNESTAIYIH